MTRNSTQAVLVTMHGGASYVPEERARLYLSLAAAARIWKRRRDTPYWLSDDGVAYPCWGDPSVETAKNDGRYHAAYAYLVDYPIQSLRVGMDRDTWSPLYDVDGMHPDYELTVGPRGGLRWERC